MVMHSFMFFSFSEPRMQADECLSAGKRYMSPDSIQKLYQKLRGKTSEF